MIDGLSIAVLAFTSRILISLSVDDTLLPWYVNLSTNVRGTFRVEMASFSIKTYVLYFVCIHAEADASCCLLQAML